MNLSGYIADLPTPFDPGGEVDFAAFRRLCEFQLASAVDLTLVSALEPALHASVRSKTAREHNIARVPSFPTFVEAPAAKEYERWKRDTRGARAVVVCDCAGETWALSASERSALIRTAAEVAGHRAAIIAGAGSNSTARAVELAGLAEEAGADAILCVVPYYNKPTQRGIECHFRAVAEASRLPILIHDDPGRTVVAIDDATVARLASSSQFVGLCDSRATPARIDRLGALVRSDFLLLAGDDAAALDWIGRGGHGCVSSVAVVVPDLCREFHLACRRGDRAGMLRHWDRLAPLCDALALESPAASVKYALSLLGLASPALRPPMIELSANASKPVAEALAVLVADVIDQWGEVVACNRR